MEVALVVGVLAVLTIAAATTIGPKFGVASPLILVVVGILVSLLPFVPAVTIDGQRLTAMTAPELLLRRSVDLAVLHTRHPQLTLDWLTGTRSLIGPPPRSYLHTATANAGSMNGIGEAFGAASGSCVTALSWVIGSSRE